MRAARQTAPDHVVVEEIPEPIPRADEKLVRVQAAAITRGELEWPLDRLPAIPSYEICGVADGEEVIALLDFDRDGGAAEYAVAATTSLAPKPRSVDAATAAALPLAGLSAWQGLFVHGALQPGETVLVTGARGAVGHLAVQLAEGHGARVVADGEADLVFDTAGREALARARGGRVVSIAEEPPDGVYFVVERDREQLVELARLVDEGTLRPRVAAVYPLAEAPAAFARLAAGPAHGKIVLDVAA
jgi:NADPH:quinone reductase-like Zn-dependent oxidoreductase